MLIDEAHNLAEAVNAANSATLSAADLRVCGEVLRMYAKRFKSFLSAKNLFFISTLRSVVTRLSAMLVPNAKGRIMESMATGVPVVSTRVGMSPDMVKDGFSGGLVDIDDVDAIVERAHTILKSPELDAIKIRARSSVMLADWSRVGQLHWDHVYRPLLAMSGKSK